MRIHHLDCGTHCPLGGALFDGSSRGPFANLCTHCLLIELADQLVLVDTGYGLADIQDGGERRLSHLWPLILNPRLRAEDCAIRQVQALGFAASDVRHIVLTHLDFDHAGGIEDFPQARVHVLAAERDAAERTRRGFVGNQRYRPLQWDGVRDWRTYDVHGETWFDFAAVRALDGLPPEILMVPLRGHTLGHAGIAVQTPNGWLLDAGDAFLHQGQLDPAHPHMPPGLALYERIMMTDPPAARDNLARLRALRFEQHSGLDIFCAHDTAALQLLRSGSIQAAI